MKEQTAAERAAMLRDIAKARRETAAEIRRRATDPRYRIGVEDHNSDAGKRCSTMMIVDARAWDRSAEEYDRDADALDPRP